MSSHSHSHIQNINNNILFQANLDYNNRPIIVFCPSRLPSNLSPHSLLNLILQSLSKLSPSLATGPYQFVLFASPPTSLSALKPLLDAYSLIDLPIRKNIATVHVVHSSFWTRITAQVLLASIVSPKMASKIRWTPDLSSLAAALPIHQICIPPDVYKFDLSLESTIVVPLHCRQPPVFEVPLPELMGTSAQHGLPRVVRDCAASIRSSLHAEGLFRRPPALSTTRLLRAVYDRRHPVILAEYSDAPFQAASLLKLFLRLLPTPLIDSSLYNAIKTCPGPPNEQAVEHIAKHVLLKMDIPSRTLLLYTLALLHDVSLHSDSNKMDSTNLATCIGPNLLRSDDILADTVFCKVSISPMTVEGETSFGTVLRLMIDRFPDVCKAIDYHPGNGCSDDASPTTPRRRQTSPHALMRPGPSPLVQGGIGSGVVAVTGVCGVNVFGMIGRGIGAGWSGIEFGKAGGMWGGGEVVTTVPVNGSGNGGGGGGGGRGIGMDTDVD